MSVQLQRILHNSHYILAKNINSSGKFIKYVFDSFHRHFDFIRAVIVPRPSFHSRQQHRDTWQTDSDAAHCGTSTLHRRGKLQYSQRCWSHSSRPAQCSVVQLDWCLSHLCQYATFVVRSTISNPHSSILAALYWIVRSFLSRWHEIAQSRLLLLNRVPSAAGINEILYCGWRKADCSKDALQSANGNGTLKWVVCHPFMLVLIHDIYIYLKNMHYYKSTIITRSSPELTGSLGVQPLTGRTQMGPDWI